MKFGQDTRNYNSIAGEAHWVEDIGQKRRFTTMDDVATAARSFVPSVDSWFLSTTGIMNF